MYSLGFPIFSESKIKNLWRKELGIPVERERWIDEEGITYRVDLALPVEDGWLPVTGGEQIGPSDALRFAAEAKPEACPGMIRARLVSSPWVGAVRNDAGLTGTRFFCSPVFDDDRQVNLLLQSKEPVTYNPTIRS